MLNQLSTRVRAPVSYGVLAVILSSAGGLYAYLQQAHAQGGHERHDAEIAQVRATDAAALEQHNVYEDARFIRIENSQNRQESKLDRVLESQHVSFPVDAPPLARVPLEDRPGYTEPATLRVPVTNSKPKDGGSP